MITEEQARTKLRTLLDLRETWRNEFDAVHARPFSFPDGYNEYVHSTLSNLRAQTEILRWVLGEIPDPYYP